MQARAKLVALQFPEGLLMYACVIADIVEKFTSAGAVVMGDVSVPLWCLWAGPLLPGFACCTNILIFMKLKYAFSLSKDTQVQSCACLKLCFVAGDVRCMLR